MRRRRAEESGNSSPGMGRDRRCRNQAAKASPTTAMTMTRSASNLKSTAGSIRSQQPKPCSLSDREASSVLGHQVRDMQLPGRLPLHAVIAPIVPGRPEYAGNRQWGRPQAGPMRRTERGWRLGRGRASLPGAQLAVSRAPGRSKISSGLQMSGASIGQAEVPPPRPTLDDTPNNLPRPLTSFIGREHELAEARRLLGKNRLLTLTGPGGSGKTRLSIRLAADVAGDFPDGVYFVPLAPVREPGLVPSSIAQHIGLQDSRGRPLLEHLAAHLRERQLLIVLDNFEHLLAAGPVVVELLKGSRALRIVVSSRSSLRVSGEQECPVPSLALPGPQTTSPASVAACESVELFVERAAAATPGVRGR